MTPEQQAAEEMREKAVQIANNYTRSCHYDDIAGQARLACAVAIKAAIGSLHIPEAKPDPRDAALAKAREVLETVLSLIGITHIHPSHVREALAAIQSVLKGGAP